MIAAVILGAACFSTFSVLIARTLRSRERVTGIGQVLTMPLCFASNAICPINIMPGWLQVIARVNPLSYMLEGWHHRAGHVPGHRARQPVELHGECATGW
ncbi:MAG: ABC transporter permease [Ktedonobacterales bacterium]